MKLAAVSAMHGRHAISAAWIDHTKSLGFDDICVAVSEDDEMSICLCDVMGIRHAIMPNDPLGEKFNAALSMTFADRIMILPSDDFASKQWVHAARTHEADYLYPHCCGTVCAQTGQAYVIEKLSFGTMRYGAGRVVSRKILDKLGGKLWPDNLGRGLDGASHQRITRAGFPITVVKTEGIPITDVKTPENLWPFATWKGSGREIKKEEALHMVNFDVYSQLFPR